jgi:flagellar protein FliO/FliZ
MNAMLKQFAAAVMIVAVVSCASAQGQASRPASRPAATTQAAPSDISDRLVGSSEDRKIESGSRDIWAQWSRTLGALALVVVLIVAARFMLKRFGPVSGARGAGVLDVLARTSVSPRHQLLLVRVGRRIVLVAQAPTSMTALSEITDPDEAASLIEAASSGARKREASK